MDRLGSRIRRVVGIVLVTVASIGSADAQDVVAYRCAACTAQQARDVALAAGRNPAYVYDLVYGQLWKFMVERDWEHGGVLAAIELPVEAQYSDSFQAWLDFLAVAGPSAEAYTEIGSAQIGVGDLTAYDVVRSSQARIRIARGIADNLNSIAGYSTGTAVSRFLAAVTRAFNIVFRSDKPTLVVKVEFHDGSLAEFVLTQEHQDGEPDYVADSAVDGNLNRIPDENAAQSAGTYSFQFRPEDIDEWVRHMRRMGVVVIRGPSIVADCTWDGRTLTCLFE